LCTEKKVNADNLGFLGISFRLGILVLLVAHSLGLTLYA
jgi:hypothetical protein